MSPSSNLRLLEVDFFYLPFLVAIYLFSGCSYSPTTLSFNFSDDILSSFYSFDFDLLEFTEKLMSFYLSRDTLGPFLSMDILFLIPFVAFGFSLYFD